MKLLRLKINTPFNSLSRKKEDPFELQFREPYFSKDSNWGEFHPFCFAGLNGSGKSNVLEALANIFFYLENCTNTKQPESFLEYFSIETSIPNSFELEYLIVPTGKEYIFENMLKITITKSENKKPEFIAERLNTNEVIISSTSRDNETDKAEYDFKILKPFLPDLVIGYSSGENEVLSIPFLKSRLINFDEYYDSIPDVKYYKPENSLIYIDYEMSQAVLLSNFLFHDKKVLQVLDDELGINDIKRFRMNINIHKIEKLHKGETKWFSIISQYLETIELFKKCSTSFYENEFGLVLDFWINDATKEAFKENFNNNIFDLFQAFQVLYTLNYKIVENKIKADVYQSKGYYTEGKLPTPSPTDSVFHFLDYFIEKEDIDDKTKTKQLLLKQLSDGEQQFLHTLGICLMLKNKSALLLLDEPETHFNPDWRSKFINTLKTSLDASGSNDLMRDILITSHSPFIISDCFPDKVIVFEKGKQPKNARDFSFRTYGTSIDIIMENIFKKNNTIGDLSRGELEDIEEEIKDLKKLSKKEVLDYKNRTSHLGDSMEKVLLFAQLNELKKK